MLLGVVCDVKENQALVRVNYQGTISGFIPYISFANSFKRHFTPPRINEQVLLLKAENGNFKCALGAIFNQTCAEPSGNAKKEVIEYEDGTIISYDSSSHTLEILNHSVLNIVCNDAVNVKTNNVKVECQKADITASGGANVTAPTTTFNGNVAINGGLSVAGGAGGSGAVISGNVRVSGNITDSKGDLTNHGHSDTDGYYSNPR